MEIRKLENGTYELSGVEVNENGVVILTKDEIQKISDCCESDNTVDFLRKYFEEATKFPAEVDAETAQQYLDNEEILPVMAQRMDGFMDEYGNNWLEAIAAAAKAMYPILLEYELEKDATVKTQVNVVKHAGWEIEAKANTWHLTKHFPKGIDLEIDAEKGRLFDDVKAFVDDFNAYDYAAEQLAIIRGNLNLDAYSFEATFDDAPVISKSTKLLVGSILAAMRIGLPEE